jgi:biofilm protein TabA
MGKATYGLLLMISIISNAANAQAQSGEVGKWLRSRVWAAGWKVKPHASVNAGHFREQYLRNPERWQKVFAFLDTADLLTLPAGKHLIDGDAVFALVTEQPSKHPDSTRWESHRRYIDLQYVIRGREKIGLTDGTNAKPLTTYDAMRDIIFYSADGRLLKASPAHFFLFFPTDLHRPNIAPGKSAVVKKIVVKIQVADQ